MWICFYESLRYRWDDEPLTVAFETRNQQLVPITADFLRKLASKAAKEITPSEVLEELHRLAEGDTDRDLA